MKYSCFLGAVLVATSLFAQQQNTAGRDAFLRQQAYAEMQRVTGQIDAIQSSLDDLRQRVAQLERGSNTKALQAEIDSLKATVVELRREIANQRGEIVKDISGRIAKMQPKDPPPPKETKPKTQIVTGPTSTYVVQNGDSLYLIAKAFNTSVPKLRELNNLKKDALKVGQKLIVPQE